MIHIPTPEEQAFHEQILELNNHLRQLQIAYNNKIIEVEGLKQVVIDLAAALEIKKLKES